MHDGVGLWLVARRLHAGKFNWASSPQPSLPISTTQLGALVLGLPWQHVGHTGAITLVGVLASLQSGHARMGCYPWLRHTRRHVLLAPVRRSSPGRHGPG